MNPGSIHDSETISTGRWICIHAFVALVLAGVLGCIVLDRESWPFSNYPMYSELYHGNFYRSRLFGVVDGTEVALSDYAYWAPLGATRIEKALLMFSTIGDDAKRIEAVVEGLARRYEDRRARGVHDGPPIAALRAYELTWVLRSGAANRGQPDARRLIAEYELDVSQ